MTDRIEKSLRKLSDSERRKLEGVLERIRTGKMESLDVKKLKARDDIYRARKGDLRVIFRRDDDGQIFILAVERKSDTTYNEF
jgi:mRNA-degrading endonuclease RelE of RelBE toxin-antitoxin system